MVIRKIGNSEGVIIPKEIFDRPGLKAGVGSNGAETDGRRFRATVTDQRIL